MYAELSAYENCHYLAFMNIFSLYITVPGTITSVKGSHDSQSQSTFVHQAQFVPANVNHLCTLLVQILVLYQLTIFTVRVAILQVELVTADWLLTLVADEADRVVGLLQSVNTLLK